ncbi:DUF1624 domain-containing protein [Rhizobiaceae bacterium n13]|uniref:DUF1624 domain-containing protein n=1 Tax=Ferirhizobium litorale TaxID=2927786 RepID=A0AAE3QES8_9HYPH|nr:DUF1624 domain-containing protein [Fererhizobium litorale]MDI7864035.1 DUF1624 domain-containing protein [Fererhizobium litorale]MDI7924482.1 DUF1624 domain-containing protein [Fererhizobium litorale]
MAAEPAPSDADRSKARIGLLDTARGVALLAMATYHFSWDLEFFGYLDAGTTTQGLWKLYARAIASSFLFLAGFSLVLGHFPAIRWRSYWKRLAMIFAAAMAITVGTAIAVPNGMIFFGILHSIAAASLVGLLFLRLPALVAIVAAVAVVVAPFYLRSPFFDTPFLWWLGLSETLPRSNDYVPLLPWLAPFLLGLAMAKIAMSRGWLVTLAAFGTGSGPFAKAGRHSLLVYLLHQPILMAIVYAISLVHPPAQIDPGAAYVGNCEATCSVEEDAAFCARFCGCTLERLNEQKLFTALQQGQVSPEKDERIQRIALECSTVSR